MRTCRLRIRPALRRFAAEVDHVPAARVFAGLAIPGALLVAAGRWDLLVYAVFGSFTGMYGFAESARQRAAHQVQAAALLITGVGAGLACAHTHAPQWVLVPAVATFAAVVSPITDRAGLRPEGPFFALFAFGAVATVAGTHTDPPVALSICVATAALCVAVGYLDAVRRPGAAAVPVVRTGIDAFRQAARYAVAISVAGGIGLLLGFGHANWAMAGAAVPLAADSARGGVRRGAHRVVGTFAGLAITAPLLLPHLPPALPAVAIIALLYPTELFMARHYALALGFFTPLIMSMTALAAPGDPAALLRDRAVDTVVGVGVGVAVVLLLRTPAPRPAAVLASPAPAAVVE